MSLSNLRFYLNDKNQCVLEFEYILSQILEYQEMLRGQKQMIESLNPMAPGGEQYLQFLNEEMVRTDGILEDIRYNLAELSTFQDPTKGIKA